MMSGTNRAEEIEFLTSLCKEALLLANKTIFSLGVSGREEVHDEHVVDISTRADMNVSNVLIDFFKARKVPAVLYSEESGRLDLTKHPKYIITFDDLDGTDNYYRGGDMLPYCSIITLVDKLDNPHFDNILLAGIIEHRTKNMWLAVRGEGCYLNGKVCKTSGREILNRRTSIVLDHYGSTPDIELFKNLYASSWVKDFGSAGFHLAGVSSGIFDAFVNTKQKGHEIGAGYLLVKEAGGTVIDFNGKDISSLIYDFNAKYKIIAGATRELSNKILENILNERNKYK